MPSECEVAKAARSAELDALAADSGRNLTILLNTIALLKANKNSLCDTAGPSYNEGCCISYSGKVGGLPTESLEERWAQLKSFAHDAIAAIDCGSANWQAQLTEADLQIQNLIDWDAGNRRLNAELTAWMASMSATCPIITPGAG